MSAIAQRGIHAVPQDIIDSIIDEIANLRPNELNKQDLWNCSLVSSAFRDRSQSWLLRTLKVEIHPAQSNPIQKSINAWIHYTLETNPRIVSYVRSMSISLFVVDYVEDLQPAAPAGFSGSPLILPNLRDLEIIAIHAYHSISFSDLPFELGLELINLIQSPQLCCIFLDGILPPTDLAALYKLNYVEVRDERYDTELTIRPSLTHLRSSPSRNDEGLQSLLCLHEDWEPFSEDLASLELSTKHLKGYAVYLARPDKLRSVQAVLLSGSLKSLHPSHDSYRLNLVALTNLAELEFILDGGTNIVSGRWDFIKNILMTLAPSNNLTTLKLTISGRGCFHNHVLAQLDDFLSDVIRFNMLRQIFVSPLKGPQALPKIFSRGIAVNGVNDYS
ncbi:hypothetical protein C0995_007844 [Termitomyces sp. Mi166|nr:hypothetical protein C0995_007844 [Termitomyces sp. Mi166\